MFLGLRTSVVCVEQVTLMVDVRDSTTSTVQDSTAHTRRSESRPPHHITTLQSEVTTLQANQLSSVVTSPDKEYSKVNVS